MSFLINGIGYHILVQALPVQVAQQTSLTGFVLRAVGMMYLVDMDDTPGYKLTVVLPPSSSEGSTPEDAKGGGENMDHDHQKNEPPKKQTINHMHGASSYDIYKSSHDMHGASSYDIYKSSQYMHGASSYDIYQSSQEIIEEARRKLDALTNNQPSHPHEEIPLDFHASVRESLFGSFVVRNPNLISATTNINNNKGQARTTTLSPTNTNTTKEAFYNGTLHDTRTESFADIDLELGHGGHPHNVVRPQRQVGQPSTTTAAAAAAPSGAEQPTIPPATDDGDGD
jgi:hypothetical protein